MPALSQYFALSAKRYPFFAFSIQPTDQPSIFFLVKSRVTTSGPVRLRQHTTGLLLHLLSLKTFPHIPVLWTFVMTLGLDLMFLYHWIYPKMKLQKAVLI